MKNKIALMARVTRDWLTIVGACCVAAFISRETGVGAIVGALALLGSWFAVCLIRRSYEDARSRSANPLNPGGSRLKEPSAGRPDIPNEAEDVRHALVNLDYKPGTARRAVRLALATGAQDFESIFRAAQKELRP